MLLCLFGPDLLYCLIRSLAGQRLSNTTSRYVPYPRPPIFSYHHDYISQRRSMSKKGKCITRMQGRKFSRSVVMVDALDEKIPRGKPAARGIHY